MSDEASLEDIRQRKREKLMTETTETEASDESPGEPIQVDGKTELTEVVDSNDIVLADFYADWCGPCKMLEPVVETLASETGATVAKIDVDTNQPLAQEYGVQGVPTLVLFADGNPVERIVGVQDEESLRRKIAEYE